MKTVYLLLALVGTLLPLSSFYFFLVQYGLNLQAFFEQLFVNYVSSFFAFDVIISAVVTSIFIATEGKRKQVPNTWLCYVGLFLAGVSSGLPLFLYFRESTKS